MTRDVPGKLEIRPQLENCLTHTQAIFVQVNSFDGLLPFNVFVSTAWITSERFCGSSSSPWLIHRRGGLFVSNCKGTKRDWEAAVAGDFAQKLGIFSGRLTGLLGVREADQYHGDINKSILCQIQIVRSCNAHAHYEAWDRISKSGWSVK